MWGHLDRKGDALHVLVVGDTRFGGWNDAPKCAEHVALLKRWSGRYGAEVISMKHDTVELQIRRPPLGRDEVLAFAWEKWGYSPDGLPGKHRSPAHTIEGRAACPHVRIWGFRWD
jgi:hypothetical protein